MREILFRGKFIHTGDWLEGWYQPPITGKHSDGREESLGVSLSYIAEIRMSDSMWKWLIKKENGLICEKI